MRRTGLASVAGALLAMSGLVVHTSDAAFQATTENAGNRWATGTVTLTDNDAGSAMFSESALLPGATGTRCLVVTYDGDLAADVRLHAQITSQTGLGAFVDLDIARGTGSSVDCSDFTAVEGAYTGTVDGLAATHPTFAAGAGSWSPTGPGQSVAYQFRWTLRDDDSAQAKSVETTFTWEARSA